jgi:hypothetical protein
MADFDRKAGMADEAELRPFFAAARAAEPPVRTDFLTAILADAAAVRAAPRPRAAAPSRRRLEAIGGRRGIAALAASAAVGFWLGTSGALPVDEGAMAETAAVADSAGPVADFFDLAAAED